MNPESVFFFSLVGKHQQVDKCRLLSFFSVATSDNTTEPNRRSAEATVRTFESDRLVKILESTGPRMTGT